jgi:acetylornithine/succinyldiaminopimelate/putrescine aminotransferase
MIKAMNYRDIVGLEERYQVPVYAKLPMAIERGEGCYVFDSEGNRYLDFYGGHCVASTGHCHPKVVTQIQRQAAQLMFYSNATFNGMRGKAAEGLILLAPEFHQVFFANSGAEANENAIKLARAVTKRTQVLSVLDGFHGRTYGALSASGIANYRDYLNTPVPDHEIVSPEGIADAVSPRTAAVIIEPIQSMGGVITYSETFFEELAAACKQAGALLIFDEIQTGVGRTGRFLYSQHLQVTPDLTTLAKGIASGCPAAAVLISERISHEIKRGDLGSTFGGSPLACAAIQATLSVIQEEGLMANAEQMGEYAKVQLMGLGPVEEVRGRGLLLGLSCRGRTAKEVQAKLLSRNILAGSSADPKILRLMPPLTVSQEDIDSLLGVIAEP